MYKLLSAFVIGLSICVGFQINTKSVRSISGTKSLIANKDDYPSKSVPGEFNAFLDPSSVLDK